MPPAKPIVFLGPSLPHDEARRLLAGCYRPPVRRGDLLPIAGGRTVAIIDGELAPDALIPAAEIRAALQRGVRLFGAASTGALRAAELAACGMIGVGWVHAAYRSGRIASAEEIAVLYDPRTLRPLTVALVSVRRWLEALAAGGDITAAAACEALAAVRRLDLFDRDAGTVQEQIGRCLGQAATTRLLARTGGRIPDVKADDARLLLRRLAGRQDRAMAP